MYRTVPSYHRITSTTLHNSMSVCPQQTFSQQTMHCAQFFNSLSFRRCVIFADDYSTIYTNIGIDYPDFIFTQRFIKISSGKYGHSNAGNIPILQNYNQTHNNRKIIESLNVIELNVTLLPIKLH